jgi:ABC-type lipoprotein release transport system permease subunit
MEEKCRDYILNKISDYEQFEDKTITDLIDMGLVSWDSVTNLIRKVDGDKFFNSTYNSSEEFLDGYLKDVYKIENLYDFEEWVNSRGIDMTTWYFQNIDLNKVIKILGGFLEIASHFTKGDIKFYKTSRWGNDGYYMYEFDR